MYQRICTLPNKTIKYRFVRGSFCDCANSTRSKTRNCRLTRASQDKSPHRHIKKILTCVSIFFIMKLGRARITFRGFSEFYVRVKSSESERTRVCEDKDLRQRSEANHLSEKICDNEVKQITCPRNSKIQDKSPHRHHYYKVGQVCPTYKLIL